MTDVEVEPINQSWLGIKLDSHTNTLLQFKFMKLISAISNSPAPPETRAITTRSAPSIATPDPSSSGMGRMGRVLGGLQGPTGAFQAHDSRWAVFLGEHFRLH
jgi:hypothetical protein